MIRLICFSIIALSIASCQQPASADDSQKTTAPNSSPDEAALLAQQYTAFAKTRKNPMPTAQVMEKGKLYPVDEAPLDTAFFVYREQLRQALAQHDVLSLLDAVAQDVKIHYTSENGIADFISRFGLDSNEPDTLEVWALLEGVLEQGGSFSTDKKSFSAPYYFSLWPQSADAATEIAITGKGVRVRAQPSLNSEVVTTVSYPIVELLGFEKEETIGGQAFPWLHIRLRNGKEGYVFGQFAGYPMGHRATFEKREGQWALTYLLTGS